MKTLEDYISNYDEVLDNLTEMLKEISKDVQDYQTDVYLYIGMDDDGKVTAELDDFQNVGGNAMLGDDHICIHSTEPCSEDICGLAVPDGHLDSYAEVLKMTPEELENNVREYHELDEDEKVEVYQIKDYIRSEDDLMDMVNAELDRMVEEQSPEYRRLAEEILDNVDLEEVKERIEKLSPEKDELIQD